MNRRRWRKGIVQLVILTLLLLPAGQSIAAVKWVETSTHAGQFIHGSADGTGSEAQFRMPQFATMDQLGRIYVADTGNHLIRQIDINGKVTTLAGKDNGKDEYGQPLGGYEDGSGLYAMFNEPKGLAISRDGMLYIADAGNGMIRALDAAGMVTTIAEGLQYPTGIVIDEVGNLYISETLAHRIVKLSPDGTLDVIAGGGYEKVGDWLIGGYEDGMGEAAQFNEPSGIALHDDGTLYIADTGNHKIRSLSLEGEVRTIAGSSEGTIESSSYLIGGFADGLATAAQFNFPSGLALAEDGTLYVADTLNHRIREITTSGHVRTVAGKERHGTANGLGIRASFDQPTDVLVDRAGNIIVIDQWNHQLRVLEWEALATQQADAAEIMIVWNKEVLNFDVPPQIISGRTMVPLRYLSERFGYEVQWDDATHRVTVSNEEQTIMLRIGEQLITGDMMMAIDVAPVLVDGRTLVPLRFVAEAFDKEVVWFADERTVLIWD